MLDFAQDNMRSAAFIGADYEEGRPDTMKGFYVSFEGGRKEPERYETLEDAANRASLVAVNVFALSSCAHYASDKKGASK